MTHHTISDRLLGEGQGFIVTIPTEDVTVSKQSDLSALRAYFFRVADWEPLYLRYNALSDFNSGENRGYDYLGSTGVGSGDDVLRVARDDFHVLHFGYAPNSPNLRIYEKVSSSATSNEAFNREAGGDGPQPGDDRGYIDGKRVTDKQDPLAVTERVSIRNDDDGELLHWGFHAEEALSGDNTVLHIVGRGYKLFPVTEQKVQDRMLETLVSNPADPALPTRAVSIGGLGQYNLGTETPEAWADMDSLSRTLDPSALGRGQQGQQRQQSAVRR